MKRLLLIGLPLLLSVGLSQQEYDLNSIEEKNGVYYKKFSDEIVNGQMFQMVGSKKVPVGKMKDGKHDGLWTFRYENGQKLETIFKDGIELKQTGWYENGQKESETTYPDGELNGLSTDWYENGQKKKETTYKDWKPDGLRTMWYENGKKGYEGTYKDGELISSKCWDEDGNDCECSVRWWEGCVGINVLIGF